MVLIAEKMTEVKDRQIKIDSSKNGQLIEFYTPGTKHDFPLNGLISEMRLDIRIRSVSEMPRITTPSALATQKEIDDAYWEEIKDVPAKQVDFYSSSLLDPEPLYRFGILLFNINTSYTETILNGFTDKPILSIAYGSKLYYKISDYNSGQFSGQDSVTLFISATEETEIQTETYARYGIPSTVAVNQSLKIIADKNTRRACLAITNSGDKICYLSTKTDAVAGVGKALLPKTSFEINRSNYTNEKITAVCASGESTYLDIEECEF